MKWLLVGLGALLILVPPTWLAIIHFAQESLIYPGSDREPMPAPGPTDPAVQQIWLETESGLALEGWYQPGRGRSAEDPGAAVLFFHGNGDLIDERWNVSGPYVERGLSFLAVEYRGYGRVGGAVDKDAMIADAHRWRAWLVKRPEVDPKRLVHHGISLGGAFALSVAETHPPAAVILESTFVSVDDLADRYLAPEAMLRHRYDNGRIIARVQVPVLIVHGRNDWVIPSWHARRLHALAPRSTLVETDAGHSNYRTDWDAILAFLDRNGVGEDATGARPGP